MISKIVAKLKTGSIKKVFPFGMLDNYPDPPYVVVRPEAVPNVGRRYRIIAHFLPCHIIDLEDYTFNEVSVLLEDFEATDRHGNNVKLLDEESYTDIIADNDDKTISMERSYYTPFRLH